MKREKPKMKRILLFVENWNAVKAEQLSN